MMKQSKRMLSVLLALIMMCSVFTVGAQAMRTSYDRPDSFDSVLDPVISTEQAATMLLDYIDANVFKNINVQYKISLPWPLDSVKIDIHDIDSLFDTMRNLNDSSTVDVVFTVVSLGDIEKLNLSVGDDTNIRRRSSNCTDLAVLFRFLWFLEVNAQYICKFVDNTFSVGALKSLGVFDPKKDLAMLNDLHGTITAAVFDAIYGKGASTAEGTKYSAATPLDDILQDFIDNSLVKFIVDMCASADGSNKVAELLGFTTFAQAGENSDLDELGKLRKDVPTTKLLPSLTDSTEEGDGKLGKLRLTTDSTYDFFKKIIKALIRDIVLPYAGPLLADLIGEKNANYIDVVVEVLKLNITFPENATTRDKVDTLLKYLLVGEGSTKYIYFEEIKDANGNVVASKLRLADGLWDEICKLIRVVLPMLPSFWDDAPNIDKTDEQLSAMSNEEFITYVLQVFLEKFVDNVDFASDCKTIKELASRTLIEVAAELVPGIDFEQQFENGQLLYNSEDCLTVAASIIQYYLNGETTIENNQVQPGIVDMFDTAVEWLMSKYGAFFGYKPENYTGADKTVWNKLYDTIFQWIPVTVFYGVEDSPAGIENLVMNKLIGSVLNFDIDGILSVFGHRNDSELMKPLPKLIVDLLARIVNPIFGLPTQRESDANGTDQKSLVFPYEYKTLDDLITVNNTTTGRLNGTGLKNTVYVLLSNLSKLHADTSCLLYQSLPLVAGLMGLWNANTYPFIIPQAPSSYPIKNGKTLTELYNKYAETANDGKSYDSDDYSYFHMVDFQPFLYLEFKRARRNVKELVDLYNGSLVNPAVTAPTRTEMTNAAYVLETYARMMEDGYNMDASESSDPNAYEYFGETTANNYQLNKTLNKVKAANYQQLTNDDGTTTYTGRTWRAYEKAYAFAVKVNNEYYEAANSSNADAELRDMRQSRINMARKMLIRATKELKAYVPLADYSALDISIGVIANIVSLRKFTQKSIDAVVAAYEKAIHLDRDYDQDDQGIIDRCKEKLDSSVEDFNVNLRDYLDLYFDGEEQFIDENHNYLFGLPEGFASQQSIEEFGDFNMYMSSNYAQGMAATGDAYNLGIAGTANGNGTGAVIKMYAVEDEQYTTPKGPSYSVVIFGDVDGDSYADACDAVLIRAYSAMLLDNAQIGDAAVYAGDIDCNSSLDIDDARKCEKAGLKKIEISQTPEARTSQTYGILDLLGLR